CSQRAKRRPAGVDGAHARDGHQGPRASGRRGQKGRYASSSRGDENGAAGPRAGRRDGHHGELPRRRPRSAGTGADRARVAMDVGSVRGRKVTIVEVGPRDGLQNEHARISTADKIELVNRLTAAHLPVVEVSAFVSPKWVPQMADAADVFAGITRAPGI